MLSTFPKNVFITGISTGVGKTIASTILCNTLKADYWKPIQTGSQTDSDKQFVREQVNFDITIHPETYLLNEPASPHYAAMADSTAIELEKIHMPQTGNRLVIEGAGGLLVPLNNTQTIADMITYLNVPVVLVASEYLGSINHTLLSIEALKMRGIELLGILFSGNTYRDNENIILQHSNCRDLGRIAQAAITDKFFFEHEAQKLRLHWGHYFQL